MKKRICAAVILLAVLAVSLFSEERAAPLSPREKIVVAYVPIMKFATLYVAAGPRNLREIRPRRSSPERENPGPKSSPS